LPGWPAFRRRPIGLQRDQIVANAGNLFDLADRLVPAVNGVGVIGHAAILAEGTHRAGRSGNAGRWVCSVLPLSTRRATRVVALAAGDGVGVLWIVASLCWVAAVVWFAYADMKYPQARGGRRP